MINSTAYSASDDTVADFGTDYAFLSLMALNPDFAAARYTIENEDASEVDITVSRLPVRFDLIKEEMASLQLELAMAYQRTEEIIQTFPLPDEFIDAQWKTYGFELGLLYQSSLSQGFRFIPSLRLGAVRITNNASYSGALTVPIRDQFDGIFHNLNTSAAVLDLGIGVEYDWKLLDRPSYLSANLHHVAVNSFDESSEDIRFSETASMLAFKADMIFPTDFTMHEHRLDLVLLLGSNHFIGENRRTLGYTTSYQVGFGSEFPIFSGKKRYGFLRLSGQAIWARNMNGWFLTIGYSPI